MIVAAMVTGIEPERKISIRKDDGSLVEKRVVQVWVKSADEASQGAWVTIVKLWDNQIDDASEMGLAINSMVSVDIKPAYHKNYKTGACMPSLTTKITAIL